MKTCPFCAEEIQEAAVVCKHCRRDLTPNSTTPVAAAVTEPAKKAPANQRAGLGCAIVFLALFGACWYILTPDDSPEATAARALSNARAITATICQIQMESRLRSPGTADFPFGHASNVEAVGDNRYRLRSYVDSQNAFGATVRTNFDCVVTGTGNDLGNYRLVSLDAE